MAVKEFYKFYLKTDQSISNTVNETFPLSGASLTPSPFRKGFGQVVGIINAFDKVDFFIQVDNFSPITTQSVFFQVREENCTGLKLASKSISFETSNNLVPISIHLDAPVFSEKPLFFSITCTTDIYPHGRTQANSILTSTTGSIVSYVCDSFSSNLQYYFAYSLNDIVECYPNFGKGLALQLERETDKIFLRKKLSGNFFFQRDDYDFVRLATIEASYTLIVMSQISGVFSEFYRGEFSKTDCSFDDDNKIFSVSPTPFDKYAKILADIDKEFDIIDLGINNTPVQYVKRPIFQVVTLGTGILSNHIGGSFWEEEISTSLTGNNLVNTYGFTAATELYGVSGYGDVDVSGKYLGTISTASFFQRDDNVYKIEKNFNSSQIGESLFEIIRVSDNVVLYATSIIQLGDEPFTPLSQRTFYGVGSINGKFSFSVFAPYTRILTDVQTVSGFTVINIPDVEDDILPYNYNYNFILTGNYLSFDITSTYTNTANKYPVSIGSYTDPSIDLPFYHIQPTPPPQTYPTSKSSWHGSAFWLSYTGNAIVINNFATKEVLNNYCYELSDVIAGLLKEIDPSLSFQKTIGTSNFLHNDTANPVTSESGFRLFISPKTNVTSSKYDLPASKAIIKLSEIFNMLKYGFNLDWYINEGDGGLRIEHSVYFENGKNYTTEQIGLDLSLLNEIYTGVPWSTGFNKFKYNKFSLPETIENSWMDEVSTVFEGYKIEIKSKYVTKGQNQQNSLSPFTSDLDFMQTSPSKINKNGFALLAAKIDLSDLIYKVPLIDIDINGVTESIQNGNASLVYMHDKFKRHLLPANLVNLNGVDITAISTMRSKVQELDTVIPDDFDELKLIKTDIGNGQIEKAEILLETDGTGRRSLKITVKYDTE